MAFSLFRNQFVIGIAYIMLMLSSLSALSLNDAIIEAEQNSPESQIWKAEDARIHAQKWQAWGEAFPQVNAYANYGYVSMPMEMGAFGDIFTGLANSFVLKDPAATPPPMEDPLRTKADQYSYGIEVQQSLFSFGRLTQTVKIANREERALTLSQQRRRNELKSQVLMAYGGVLLAEARLGVIDASLQRQKESVDFLERNFKAGSGAKAHLLMARAGLYALEPQKIQAAKGVQLARIQLGTLLGRKDLVQDSLSPIHQKIELSDTTYAIQEKSNWIDKRKDYQSLTLQLESLEGQAKYIEMLSRPSFGASGKLGILAFEPDQLTDMDYNEWMVGLGFRWNLFNGRQNHYKSEQIRAEARIMRTKLTQMRSGINMEVESALADARSCMRTLEATTEGVAAAKEAWELQSDAYKRGSGLLVDMLAAEEMYRTQELAALAAYWESQFAAVRLQLALGKDVL